MHSGVERNYHLETAECYRQACEYENALKYYDLAIREEKNIINVNLVAYLGRAAVCFALGDPQNASSNFQFCEYLLRISELNTQDSIKKRLVQLHSLQSMRNAIQRIPSGISSINLQLKPHEYLSCANKLLELNLDLDKVIEYYSYALERSEFDVIKWKIYNDRGDAYYLKENYAAAISDYTHALEIFPNCANSKNKLNEILKEHSDLDPNKQHITTLDEYFECGRMLFNQNEIDSAINLFNSALKMTNDLSIKIKIYYYLGLSHEKQDNLAMAIYNFFQALQISKSTNKIISKETNGALQKLLERHSKNEIDQAIETLDGNIQINIYTICLNEKTVFGNRMFKQEGSSKCRLGHGTLLEIQKKLIRLRSEERRVGKEGRSRWS